jgi:hypothetical protein
VINIHLDEKRGELAEKAFVPKRIRRYLDSRPWVRAQQLSLGLGYGAHRGQDLEHLELNEVDEGKPANYDSSVLRTDMHAKYI